MIIFSYVLFGIFIILSITHLVFCYLKLEKARKISKVFCIGVLSISFVFRFPTMPCLYLGLALGAVGDYFLIKKENLKSLITGIGFFFAGHCLYALQILLYMHTPTWGFLLFIVLITVLILLLILFLYPKLKYMAHNATAPGISYFTFLVTTFILGIALAIVSKQWIGPLILCLGYALFISSDSYLLFSTYIKPGKRDDFWIMLTYLTGQALIVIGLALVGIVI